MSRCLVAHFFIFRDFDQLPKIVLTLASGVQFFPSYLSGLILICSGEEMAGSRSEEALGGPFADPILAARLEALKQLADGLTDRVAVMDQEYNIVYANDSAWGSVAERQRTNRPAK